MEDAGRVLARRLLERISTDDAFRRRLVDDHQAALEEAGFIEEMRQLQQGGDAEVGGYMMSKGGGCSPHRITCLDSRGVPSGPVG